MVKLQNKLWNFADFKVFILSCLIWADKIIKIILGYLQFKLHYNFLRVMNIEYIQLAIFNNNQGFSL